MAKLIINNIHRRVVNSKDMLIGQIGILLDYPHSGKVILRIFGTYVDLDAKHETWDCSLDLGRVELLNIGEAITLEQID